MGTRVSILGAGNGGCATAAHLGLRGVACTLFDLPAFEGVLSPIREAGALRVSGVLGEATVPLPLVTTDVRAAVDGADVLVLAVPAFAQEPFARAIAPFLADGQVLVLTPGATGGALAFAAALRAAGAAAGVVVAETLSLPYACRKAAPDHVHVAGVKRNLPVAAFPASETGHAMAALGTVFPDMLVPAAHVLETSLNNPNAMAHPVPVLLNAGWIETTGGDFRFYADGISPSVARAVDALDADRLAVVAALGLPRVEAVEWDRRLYGLTGATTYELNQLSWVHRDIRAPDALRTRYLTEDVPFGLVPIASIGRELGVRTPVIDLFVDLACTLLGEDLRAGARTAASLGLGGLGAREMLEFVRTGERAATGP
jgi:opine dehydrogenase